MSIVSTVRGVLPFELHQTRSRERTDRLTRLYRCESCGTVYVSEEMESCSDCDTLVERVPTEEDLGLL
ncbi:hypothetical protein [Halosimplex sp. TS25]|uniref:hypothetical protein n=1 Tax=Halosimplex rarum TaxID=3396619 RepID=UPI0039EA8A26